MKRSYEFRKLYVDVVTSDGDVVVVYLTYVCLAGMWTARASVEWYPKVGQRRLLHGVLPPPIIGPDTALGDLPLQIDLPNGTFHLSLAPQLGRWEPQQPSPVDSLHWHIKAVRTKAQCDWTLDGKTGSLKGTGYADWVHITRPTRMLGMRNVYWGRVHFPDRTVVFEQLETNLGVVWDVGLDWSLNVATPRFLAGPPHIHANGRGAIALTDGPLHLEPKNVLHKGDAFDAKRIPNLLDRWAAVLLGGSTKQTRWLGSGHLCGVSGSALYEHVQFGKPTSKMNLGPDLPLGTSTAD